jgi:hypothetical protein
MIAADGESDGRSSKTTPLLTLKSNLYFAHQYKKCFHGQRLYFCQKQGFVLKGHKVCFELFENDFLWRNDQNGKEDT